MSENQDWPQVEPPGRPLPWCGWCKVYPKQAETDEGYPRCAYCLKDGWKVTIGASTRPKVFLPTKLYPLHRWVSNIPRVRVHTHRLAFLYGAGVAKRRWCNIITRAYCRYYCSLPRWGRE